MRSWAVRFLAAQVTVFLWYAPYTAKFIQDDSRLAYLWEPVDAASLMGGMVVLAVACTLADSAVRLLRRPGLARAFDHVFVVALAGGLLNNIAFHCTRDHGYSISAW